MERRNEGPPGGWTRASRAERLPDCGDGVAVFRPVQAMVSTMSSVLPGRRQHATSGPAPEPAPEEEREEEEEPPEREEPPPMEVRLAGWTRSLDSVASVSDAVAVEGMKSLCHEVMAAVGDGEMLSAMAPDSDRLVGLLADRVSPISRRRRRAGPVHDPRVQVRPQHHDAGVPGAHARGVRRGGERARDRRRASGEASRSKRAQDGGGAQLVKALNVLMLKLLEHRPRTNSFRALLRLPADAPESVADEPAALVKFHDLVVKCPIKLTKSWARTSTR